VSLTSANFLARREPVTQQADDEDLNCQGNEPSTPKRAIRRIAMIPVSTGLQFGKHLRCDPGEESIR